MANNYTSKAQIVLSVNGKQAEQMLKSLEKEAEILRKKMDEAAKIGDKDSLKKLQRELKATERQINMIKGASQSVDEVLRRLDKASPKELNKTLAQLKRELNGIERGSEVWNDHINKIKQVKAEIDKVNSSMREQQSVMGKVNEWIDKWQNTIMVAGAGLTGLIMAGRKAVTNYADMEQEMANVRKFTGMSEEEVMNLNEEFKKIDTRTGREELNKLAQEAGRLGKTSHEDVLGFVRAADKINVALDDLGDGATLTLSKLAGIFGDEKRLGTEKSLLSIGSVINELSQNCSASAPYLAEFASRVGGVGAQAGLTVQQIMAYAAVLDSNNQALEASATALSQVMVRIYQDPAKYARVAGIEIEKFTSLVKTDMNAAMIEFLNHLNKAGSMDVLSPMFKDMGENGSRAISALSTLAGNIDAVREQQINANKAFAEAVSIDKEFDVQNNTVQAGLEKAKNQLTELSIELGEKLKPAMSSVISSSTLAVRALSVIVDFFIKYKTEILSISGAIIAYNAIMLIYNTRTAIATATTTAFHGVLNLCKGILPALKLMIAAATNAVQYFTNGLQVSYFMQERWQQAMSKMKFANWIGLILSVAAAVFLLSKRWKESKSTVEEFAEARRKIEADAEISTKNQITLLDNLYKKTQDQNAAEEERLAAINKLRDIYPEYFKDLSNEAILAGKAANAYQNLRDSILESARAKGRENRIADLENEIQELQSQYNKEAKPFILDKMKVRSQSQNVQNDPLYKNAEWALGVLEEKYQTKIDELKREQESLAAKNLAFEISNINTNQNNDSNTRVSGFSGSVGGASSGSGSKSMEDRFKKENEYRQRAEAAAKIFYATGIASSIEYNKAMDEISVEYNKRILQREDLTAQERMKYTVDFAESVKQQKQRFNAESIEQEYKRYNESLAQLKQYYIDGKISKEGYDDFSLMAEAEHIQNLINLQEEGSDERLRLEDRLTNMLIQQMQKRQEETKRLEQQYADVKKQYFGLNAQEKQAELDKELSMLDVVYKQEIEAAGNNATEKLRIEKAYEKAKLALKKKYGLLSSAEEKNAMKKGIADSIAWLNSEGGQAVTKSFETLTSGMTSIFSQLSSLMKAELEIQTAAITDKYDKEIKAAEGNSYQVAQLEKKKEDEIAKVKNEANKKMFAIQVIQAVAQTATAALNAYSSAAAIPVTGWIMAPIAAAMAVAAGAIQIASIKKQQAAATSQGYSEGGFTKEGGKYEPVGVVHAGEWVASQSLTHNPRVRPILEVLDYAQQTNSYPNLSPEYVTIRNAAPTILAQNGLPAMDSRSASLENTIQKLNRRLDDPFYSVTTIAGDKGVAKATEKYNRLIKNKR